MFEEVEARRKRLEALRPYDLQTARRLNDFFEPWIVWASNALEGNTMSFGDTVYLIREGRLPSGKREDEYLEVKGQQAAYAYIQEGVRSRFPLTEKLVREIHQLLTEKLDAEKFRPGQYKDRENQVRLPDGTLFPYVTHVETPAAMRDLVSWYGDAADGMHPIERAAWLHYKFILIHPFRDGNGRTARMLTNLSLMQAGYVPAIFHADARRPVYLGALREVDTSVPQEALAPNAASLNIFPFASYLEQELLLSYDSALDVVEGRLPVNPEDLVGAFLGLEEKALRAVGIGTDVQARLDFMAAKVSETSARVSSLLAPVVDAVNDRSREFELVLQGQFLSAVDALTTSQPPRSSAWLRRQALGLGDSPGRGRLAVQRLSFGRKPGHHTEAEPSPNHCEFLVYAEPHGVLLAALFAWHPRYFEGAPDAWSARVRFPFELGDLEIRRFVVDAVNRLLSRTSADLGEV